MKTGLITSLKYTNHLTSSKHLESPERITKPLEAIKESDIFNKLLLIEPKEIDPKLLELVHSKDYIQYVYDFTNKGGGYIDVETSVSKESYNTALLAAGGVIEGLNCLLEDKLDRIFVLCRPPGHHAMRDNSMGFCLFNNIAIGAKYLIEYKNFKRILIIDWDNHHGNGTESTFYQSKEVLFISIHQSPNWPFISGYISSTGDGEGEGYNINIPLDIGYSDSAFLEVFDKIITPIAYIYKPEIILISSGYDNHFLDPIGKMNLTVSGYVELAKRAINLADNLCNNKILFCLEGGYNTSVLNYCIIGTLAVMIDKDSSIKDPLGKPEQVNSYPLDGLINKVKSYNKFLSSYIDS